VSRAMATEIKEGRGAGENGDHVLLKLDHLGIDTIMKRLPSIRAIALEFANVDCIKEPIPVVPTCHYQMGGIPTNYRGEVVVPKNGNDNSIVQGFYAAGEIGCASIHGANRLGTNSLTDLLVMGKSAGDSMIEYIKSHNAHRELPNNAADYSLSRINRLDTQKDGEEVADVRNALQRNMQDHCGVFRFPDMLKKGVDGIQEIAKRVERTQIKDKSKVFNTARIEALELDNLIEAAVSTMVSAEARKESRGAHDVEGYHDKDGSQKRDDDNWLKHSLWYKEGSRMAYKGVNMKPLTAAPIPLKKRTY
jgi:succinate dehydrogenase / fumarate reductase, flavoprotein subunit